MRDTTLISNKPKRGKPFVFTPQHEEILRDALFPYHLLKASQITALIRPGKPGNLKKIQERLSQLRARKYVTADPLATKRGSRPLVYALGLKGKRYLEEIGHTVAIYYSPAEFEQLTYKKLHTLELNNFLLLAATLPVFAPHVTFSDLHHELLFERKPLEYLEGGTGEVKCIKPDGLFKLHHERPGKTQRHLRCWVELDRGTVSDRRMQGKLAAIYDFIKRGYFERFYGFGSVLVLCVSTAGRHRVEHVKRLFRQQFPGTSPTRGRNQLFKFAAMPSLLESQPTPLAVFCQPYWQTAYGDPERRQTLIELEAEEGR